LQPGQVAGVTDLQRPRSAGREVELLLEGEEDILVPETGEGALQDLAVALVERLGLVVGAGTRQQSHSTERDHQSRADDERRETPQQSHNLLPLPGDYRQGRFGLEERSPPTPRSAHT